MLKGLLKVCALFILIVFAFGCSMRLYSQKRERVDQELPGYQGFAQGIRPPSEVRPPMAAVEPQRKKTRTVYVLEVTSKAKKEKQKQESQLAETQAEIAKAREEIAREQGKTQMAPQNQAGTSAGTVQPAAISIPEEYVVQPDDTLQKIAKKFYNSYSKWNKIYDLNKDKIKDPNHIQSGIKIKLPKE